MLYNESINSLNELHTFDIVNLFFFELNKSWFEKYIFPLNSLSSSLINNKLPNEVLANGTYSSYI